MADTVKRWTNKSVAQLAGATNPIDVVVNRARQVTLDAMADGWSGPPFDPVELALRMGIAVEPREDIPDARTVPAPGNSLKIEFNPNRPRGRVRYSIAHEIAHTFFPDCAEQVDTEFNYEIPGGLEPGENASWRLTPNMFGEWSKVPADRLDTIFVVRAIQLDGADRKPLGPERLGDSEEARLLELLDGIDGDRPKAVRALLDARRAASLAWREKTVPIAAVQERDELHLAREQLSKIRILRTRLVKRERGFLSEPIVEALIENGSPSIIEWVRGEIKITSADREVPWDEGQFIGLARPGLEPGAQAWVSLSKSSTFGLGRWTLPPEDAKAEVQPRVESAEAPKTASPFELEFTARDEKRLEALEALIAAQAWK